jgi:hypothetical protein
MIRLLLASVAMIGLLGTGIVFKTVEERKLRDVIAGHEACSAAVTQSELAASAARCSEAVAAVHRRAVQAQACDAALTAGDTYSVRAACSTEVMTVVADRDAKTAEVATLSISLAQVRRDQAAAITRAEARGRTQTQRTHRAEDALAQAPVTAGGLGRCDADCLRNLGRD